VAEANFVLREFGIELVPRPLKGDEVQSLDPVYVARRSLEHLLRGATGPIVVEDTGLFVRALHGFPGALASYVHSTIGLDGLLKLLVGQQDRSAYFEAAVGYGEPPKRVWVFTGRVYGKITTTPKGRHGFGFDPIFVPEGRDKTLAQMTLEEKSSCSHRALAFTRMGAWVSGKRGAAQSSK